MSHFFAFISRMKFINRWGLMRSSQTENVAEHSLQVAQVAHALAVIKNKFFDGNLDVNKVTTMAIYHDVTEVITGDLPTPIKYFNQNIKNSYLEIEKHASEQLINMLPAELKEDFDQIINCEDEQYIKIVKAADNICALLKCLEEKSLGNPDFAKAQKTIETKIKSNNQPEVQYFIEKFLPSFNLTIDDIH